ncbi:MAG: uracil-DNA glycosylase [bacterium]
MSEWSDSIDEVIQHVTLLKELGQRTVELPVGFFAKWDVATPVSKGNATQGASQARPSSVTPSGKPAPFEKFKLPDSVELDETRSPVAGIELSAEAREQALAKMAERVAVCTDCPLHAGRTKTVLGQGNSNSPDVMFIGEAPAEEDDIQGLAFVGAAGLFLTKMINAMGYQREDVYIANICKCHPPGNRPPEQPEIHKCLPFLREQIGIVRPKIIVLLGGTAIKALLNQAGVMRMQGQWTAYEGIPVMPTYHPSYIIRFENKGDVEGTRTAKLQAWNALKLVLARLGKSVPAPKK